MSRRVNPRGWLGGKDSNLDTQIKGLDDPRDHPLI